MSYMELYDSKDIKATRKDHQCFLCFLNIPKGTQCFYEKGKWDGDMFSRHSHNECSTEWTKMNDSFDAEWYPLHEMDNFKGHLTLIRKAYLL